DREQITQAGAHGWSIARLRFLESDHCVPVREKNALLHLTGRVIDVGTDTHQHLARGHAGHAPSPALMLGDCRDLRRNDDRDARYPRGTLAHPRHEPQTPNRKHWAINGEGTHARGKLIRPFDDPRQALDPGEEVAARRGTVVVRRLRRL